MQDIPQASEQYQGLTSSVDGKNVMPRLQPISHFFLEGDNFSQTELQKFGPISESVFNTTSKVTFTGTKKVYAICQGTVFIQPQTGDVNKVNLILKPYKQPINGLSIKYFIYRGLNKNDFVNGLQVAPKGSNATGFVNYIWDEFESFHDVEDGETAPSFLAKYIGFPENEIDQEVSAYIDQFFYKIATYTEGENPQENPEEAYELPIIPRGTHLGNATESIGLDIILNRGDYYIENDPNPFKLDLAFARVEDGKLETTGIPEGFETKLLKEACTQFIDPAAFYGTHANGIGKLFIDEVENPITTKEQIASKLNGFLTKNTIYLYIQGERRRSYNFYNNYQYSEDNINDLKIGHDSENLTETEYRTLGWPVYIHNETQDPNSDTNIINLQLITDNNDRASLYIKIGTLISSHNQNFIRSKELLQDITEEEIDINYTSFFSISYPSVESQNIATLIQIIYKGKSIYAEENSPVEVNGITSLVKDIDSVFGLINAKSFIISSDDTIRSSIIEEECKIVYFSISLDRNDIITTRTKKIEDKIFIDEEIFDRVTYETNLQNTNRDTTSFLKTGTESNEPIIGRIENFGNDGNEFYKPKSPYYYQINRLEESNGIINTLELKTIDNTVPTKFILGISKAEDDTLNDLLISNEIYNPTIFFTSLLGDNVETFVSINAINYKIYKLGVLGEDNLGELRVFNPFVDLLVYTIDEKIFFTREYSQNIFENIQDENENFLDIINPDNKFDLI